MEKIVKTQLTKKTQSDRVSEGISKPNSQSIDKSSKEGAGQVLDKKNGVRKDLKCNELKKEVKKPYLKWPGGKTKLISKIENYIPKNNSGCFVEPFCGSATVSLNLAKNFKEMILSDMSADLILTHQSIITDSKKFIKDLRELFSEENNERQNYIKLREEFNNGAIGWRRALIFAYLNRHCFNGLCRYSSKGKFNTPFGQIKAPYFPEEELKNFSLILGNAKIYNKDFREVMAMGKSGDFIYCDPPYVALTDTANFASYSAGGFSTKDQKDLAILAQELAKKGATVVISNHDTEFVRNLYKNAKAIESLEVSRTIAANAGSRKKVSEVLAVFRP